MKYWEIIADNLNKAGWSWGWVSAIDSNGRTIWIADAHRDDGRHKTMNLFHVVASCKARPYMKIRRHLTKSSTDCRDDIKTSSITSSDVSTYLRHG